MYREFVQTQNHQTQSTIPQVLLRRYVLVGGQQNLETVLLRQVEKTAVEDASPTLIRDRGYFVVDKKSPQPP